MRAWMPFHLMLLKANKHGMRDRLQDLHTAMDMTMLSSGDSVSRSSLPDDTLLSLQCMLKAMVMI